MTFNFQLVVCHGFIDDHHDHVVKYFLTIHYSLHFNDYFTFFPPGHSTVITDWLIARLDAYVALINKDAVPFDARDLPTTAATTTDDYVSCSNVFVIEPLWSH